MTRSLISELRRRGVIRLALLYAIAAWLIVQVAGTVLPMFAAPEWVARVIVVLLAVGFVPALVLAWMFDLTPHGLRREADASSAPTPAPPANVASPMPPAPPEGTASATTPAPAPAAAFATTPAPPHATAPSTSPATPTAAASAATPIPPTHLPSATTAAPQTAAAASPETTSTTTNPAATATAASPTRTHAQSDKAIDSIAVLPFQLSNSDDDTEYLADGLGESLIYRLSRLSGLKVAPTSSLRRFRGSDVDPLQAGRDLGVKAVLAGRFTQRGDTLVVSVELLDVREDRLLWGERFDRKLSELLATQREITNEIVQNLDAELSAHDRASLGKQYTTSNEAYQVYLKGRHHYSNRTRDGMNGAIDCYRRAIELDPTFALAYAAIADAYNAMPLLYYVSANEAYPRAIAATRHALQIDPALGEAHAALAFALATHDWTWGEAEREFRRAIELNPRDAQTRVRFAVGCLAPTGRTQEAVAECAVGVELEPLSAIVLAQLATARIYARQFPQALEDARRLLPLDPAFPMSALFLGLALLMNAKYDEAIALFSETRPGLVRGFLTVYACCAYARSNREAEARALLAQYAERAAASQASHYWLATMHAALGDRDAAIAALERACEERDFFLPRMAVDPLLDELRGDGRFEGIVRKIGLAG